MTDEVTLLPCPFCGGPAEYDSHHYAGKFNGRMVVGHAIYCAATECIGCPHHSNVWQDDEGGFEAAAEAWNTRIASGIEAPSGDETRSGSAEGESPAPQGDAR